MKNIHILPTDKKIKNVGDLVKDQYGDIHIFTKNDGKEYGKTTTKLNIYITSSDEDINENDYIITKDGRLVQVSYLLSKDLDGASKVILTTDVDLIADGVQAIDDEFLEWFVKNPSCEEVFITNDFEQVNQDNPILRGSTNVVHKYKIIIPKEESKEQSDLEEYISLVEKYTSSKEEPKQEKSMKDTAEELAEIAIILTNNSANYQETLEEATELFFRKKDVKNCTLYKAAKFGAKWQQERMYSEEEAIAFGEFIFKNTLLTHAKGVKNLFEQFKKK